MWSSSSASSCAARRRSRAIIPLTHPRVWRDRPVSAGILDGINRRFMRTCIRVVLPMPGVGKTGFIWGTFLRERFVLLRYAQSQEESPPRLPGHQKSRPHALARSCHRYRGKSTYLTSVSGKLGSFHPLRTWCKVCWRRRRSLRSSDSLPVDLLCAGIDL